MKDKKERKQDFPEFFMLPYFEPWIPNGVVVDKHHKNASKAEKLCEFSKENEK